MERKNIKNGERKRVIINFLIITQIQEKNG